MTYPLIQRELTIHLHNGSWYARPIEDESGILGPVDYGWRRYNLYPDSFTFGEGLLAGSSIPGSRRLVLCGWSPQWEGFYISSLGGAAYTFHGVGINYVALRGQAAQTSVLILNHRQGQLSARLEPIHPEPIWNGYADPQGEPLLGFFALQQAIYDRYAGEYAENRPPRVLCVGPAAANTPEGAIGSSPVRKGSFSAVVDWAGRGGLGSRLLQYHRIAGIIFGGEWDDPDLRDSAEIDAYFVEHFGKRTIQADLAATEKYRYVPQFETGGTFGVNMRDLNERILSFNYRSIYASEEQRLRQHRDFILNHYLSQFNEETIRTKSFQHCGEPCAVVCKKLNGRYKKDYEPYHTLGPQTGIFDQRAAEVLNDYVDAMGLDAIQTGCTLAWIMELIADGWVEPEQFGFPPATQLKFHFCDDVSKFDLVNDSRKNANYALAMLHAILFDERAAIFRQGMRAAARQLDQQLSIRSIDRAVFISHGESGYMAPNQYWTPGMLSPMPMMGKYFVYYGVDFLPPEVLGRKNVERMTYELFNENSGICRFHRKWAEVITDEILCAHYGLDVDYKAHQFQLAYEIYQREAPKASPWECERLLDLLIGFLEQWRAHGLQDPVLASWLQRFAEDKQAAGRAFWEEIRRGIAAGFAAGPQTVPNQLSEGQKKNLSG